MMLCWRSTSLSPLFALCLCASLAATRSFVPPALHRKTSARRGKLNVPVHVTGRLSASSLFDEWQEFQAANTNLALVDALVKPSTSLSEVFLVGQTKLLTSKKGETTPSLVLSTNQQAADRGQQTSCIIIPINDAQLKLISFAVQAKPLSKSLLLTLNPLLVNRDGALFDNIPWSTWTVDPLERNRDAANNFIDAKFHLGKRDAFARFGGKDWKGRSVSIGNIALRLKYTLNQLDDDDDASQTKETTILTKRVLEMQIREIKEDLAEIDYELAVAKQNDIGSVAEWEERRVECIDRLEQAEQSLVRLTAPKTTTSILGPILDNIAETATGDNAAPYRGATGYSPLLDSEGDIDASTLPFTSPFGLMVEILEDQCKARVIGALLENTSLLEGTLAVGGAIIMQRITARKAIEVEGQQLSVNDESVDYGNTGTLGGETILVECEVDEAIGMALTAKVPLQVENEIWSGATATCQPDDEEEPSDNVFDVLPNWQTELDLSVLVEGQARNESSAESEVSPLRIPRTTTSLFDALFESANDGNSSSSRSSSLFPSDNPVQSLPEFDSLSVSDKAQTLMSMSNFEGKLPRPRILRKSSDQSPLDDLLLPLIDESVRRQYLIRDAERRQDYDAIRELESVKSARQFAKEMAEEARDYGDDSEASEWEDEADFYSALRADVTQDEGAYDRFLDKDEWYERDRQAQTKKLDKKKFGSLLDGIE